jgi:parallel beta-helix repeat protein
MSRQGKGDMRFGTTTIAQYAIAIGLASVAHGAIANAAAQALCGAEIVADFRLDHDLTCAGDAFIVGADDITIDLDGHTLTGAGTGIGINVTGRSRVSIKRGTISNFAFGVRLNTASGVTIRRMHFSGNPEGIDMQAGTIGNTIKDNTFRDSAIRAIMLRGNVRGNDVKDNVFINNRVGILVFAGVDNRLRDNRIYGSTLAGIRVNVFASGNRFDDNVVSSSLAGIEFLVTPTGSGVGNEFRDNAIQLNGCGIKGPTAGNSFRDNSFAGNVVDVCS